MTVIHLGDKCSVPGRVLLIKHYGICVGFGSDMRPVFVHNVADGVVMATEQGFAEGRPIAVEQRAQPGMESTVAQRALALRGRKYDLLAFNCEHAANLAANGMAESKQVQRAVAASLSLAFVAYLNKNGTSVDRNGYRRNSGGQFASRRWW